MKSYAYDAAGRTTGVTSSSGTTTLSYDYEGRVSSISAPGVSNTFTYNGLDTRVGKVDSAGTSTYRRDGADVTDDVLSDGSAVYTPGVSQRRSGSTTYDLHDRLGTASRQTNAAASLTATRTYDAFGMLVSSTGTPQGPFGFAGTSGYQEDGDTGLKLLGHRYYDPSTGRFLSRDPAKDGRNWYAYCDGNPLTHVDSNGLTWENSVLFPGYQFDPSTGQWRPAPGIFNPNPTPLPGLPLDPGSGAGSAGGGGGFGPTPKPPVTLSGPLGGGFQGDPGPYGTVSGTLGGTLSGTGLSFGSSQNGYGPDQTTVTVGLGGGGYQGTYQPPQNGKPPKYGLKFPLFGGSVSIGGAPHGGGSLTWGWNF